jgi:hypothetical protein
MATEASTALRNLGRWLTTISAIPGRSTVNPVIFDPD